MSALRTVLVATPVLIAGVACGRAPEANTPLTPLGNPVLDARAALADGDSTFLVLGGDSLFIPGVDRADVTLVSEPRYRLISPRTLDIGPARWAEQQDSLTVYAAAYNRLIFEARSGRT